MDSIGDAGMTIGGAWVDARSTLFLCRHPPANLLQAMLRLVHAPLQAVGALNQVVVLGDALFQLRQAVLR